MKPQTLPHDTDAEKSVIGTLISSSSSFQRLNLSSNDFFPPKHKIIFEVIAYLHDKGEAYDLISVTNRLKEIGKLDSIGGIAYLSDLTDDNVPNTQMLKTYAKIIKDAACRRNMAQIFEEARSMALNTLPDIDETRAEIEKAVLPVLDYKNGKSKIVSTRNEAQKHLKIIEQRTQNQNAITGLSTGYDKLDRITGGLQSAESNVLAGRPSMGKTTIAMNIVNHVAISQKVSSLIFSLEMSKSGLMDKQYSALADINLLKIRQGQLHDSDWPKITRAAGMLTKAAPIFIDDSGALQITEIRSRARQVKAEHNIGLIVVDYLQLIRSPQKNGSREQEISTISQNLKAMAKELDVPVLALSQLNRSLESRKNKRPQLSDLRESGAIEQDADLILFIYRDEVYNQDTPDKGLAELIIGKQRNGPTGTVKLKFEGETSKFLNMV